MRIIHCPACGASAPADFHFCGMCGGALPVGPPTAMRQDRAAPTGRNARATFVADTPQVVPVPRARAAYARRGRLSPATPNAHRGTYQQRPGRGEIGVTVSKGRLLLTPHTPTAVARLESARLAMDRRFDHNLGGFVYHADTLLHQGALHPDTVVATLSLLGIPLEFEARTAAALRRESAWYARQMMPIRRVIWVDAPGAEDEPTAI